MDMSRHQHISDQNGAGHRCSMDMYPGEFPEKMKMKIFGCNTKTLDPADSSSESFHVAQQAHLGHKT
jgi:hypothetical protein